MARAPAQGRGRKAAKASDGRKGKKGKKGAKPSGGKKLKDVSREVAKLASSTAQARQDTHPAPFPRFPPTERGGRRGGSEGGSE